MALGGLFKRGRRTAPPAPPRGPAIAAPTARPAPSGAIRPRRGAATWVPAGENVAVDGRLISGGMVYIGSGAKSVDGHETEPCLIDPRLPVGWKHPDWAGTAMGYWPSYDRIDRRARAAYLNWLIDGRRDKSAYIGYVFLFFYGLERRLLFDLGADFGHPDAAVLVAEMERLVDIYGDNRSFAGYAGNLLDVAEASRAVTGDVRPVRWDPGRRGWEMPVAVRIGIGRYVANGLGIPAEWALSYLRHHPEGALRTSATRCQSEFDELFTLRYRARFPDGMRVRRPATKLRLDYRPASGGIRSGVSRTLDAIPDIMAVSGPINKLKDLGAECMDALDAYSRFVGRRADEIGTAAAIALLPDELLSSHGGQIVAGLRTWTSEVLAGGSNVAVPLDELVQRWSPGRVEKLAKRDAASLASLLAKVGVGLEPDVRFGAPTPKLGSDAVLFQMPDGAAAAPSTVYTAAMSLVHLTAVVAAADGTISPSEQQHLAEHAEHVLGLDAAERARLDAHFAFLAAGKVGMAGMKRKIEALAATQRAHVGRFLIDVAAADGVVSPEEITTLTKLFVHLGLDETDVYRQVHALGAGDTGPIAVRDAQPSTRWAVPAPTAPETQPTAVVLDHAKVQARLAETAHVTALLNDIFADDDSGTAGLQPLPDEATTASAPAAQIEGMDAAHSTLAAALATQSQWGRGDVERLAESFGLPLLAGAIDVINEVALDTCGELLIEGEDPVTINDYAIEEML